MKRTKQLKNIIVFTTGFITFILTAKSANAFSLIGLNFNLNINLDVPVNISTANNPQSPVDVIYTEGEESFELTVKTNSVFNPEKDYKFDVRNDKLWSLNLTFNYQNGFVEDESTFELNGTVFHNFKPRGVQHQTDEKQGSQFQVLFPSFNLETELTNKEWNNNTFIFDKPGYVPHRKEHRDNYEVNKLTITRNASELEELSSFTYVLNGKHEAQPVPEPSTLLGLSSLAVLGAGSILKRKLKQNPN